MKQRKNKKPCQEYTVVVDDPAKLRLISEIYLSSRTRAF